MKKLRINRTPILFNQSSVSKREIFVNCDTCESSNNLEDVVENGKPYQVIPTKGSARLDGIKVMYDETEDMVALVVCSIDSSKLFTNSYPPTKRKWEEKIRYYIDKDKQIFACVNSENAKKNTSNLLYSIFGTIEPEYFKEDRREKILKWSTKTMFTNTNPFIPIIIDAADILEDKDGKRAWDGAEEFKAFKKLFPNIVPLSGNTMAAIDSLAMLEKFMLYKEPKLKEGKKQERLEDLISISDQRIPDLKVPNYEINRIFDSRATYDIVGFENVYKLATIQKVPCDEPMCVVRTFAATKNKNGEIDEIKEGGRIYVGKKEVIACRTLMDGTFIHQPLLNKPIHWNFNIEWDGNPDTVKGTMLEYFSSIVGDLPDEQKGSAIWCFIKYPIVEQLFKTEGTKEFMCRFFELALHQTPEMTLNCMFGSIDYEEKSIYKKIGLNKYQLKKLAPMMAKNMPFVTSFGIVSDGAIGIFKLIASGLLGETNMFAMSIRGRKIDVSHLDNNTTDKIAKLTESVLDISSCMGSGGFLEISGKDSYRFNRILQIAKSQKIQLTNSLTMTISTWNLDTAIKICDKLILIHCEEDSIRMPTNLYSDFCRMVVSLRLQSRVKPYFDNREQLRDMHDELVELMNAERNIAKKNEWQKRLATCEWKNWEFDDDDEFIVVAPKVPSDIANEGITLHHCVKSYIDRVTMGYTNIMFIRRKSEPDVPFYTVEITNDKVIQQVHGFANKNACETPGLEEFIRKWERACKLSSDTYNKVR